MRTGVGCWPNSRLLASKHVGHWATLRSVVTASAESAATHNAEVTMVFGPTDRMRVRIARGSADNKRESEGNCQNSALHRRSPRAGGRSGGEYCAKSSIWWPSVIPIWLKSARLVTLLLIVGKLCLPKSGACNHDTHAHIRIGAVQRENVIVHDGSAS